MNIELVEKWENALNSGNYKQTRECTFLSERGGFCCLAVLADVCGNEKIKKKYLSKAGKHGNFDPKDQKILGLTDQQEQKFIDMNDKSHLSFKQIASRIRKVLKEF